MGWLRSVGSIKLQVSFAKEPYKTDDILLKRLNPDLDSGVSDVYRVATISRLLEIIGLFCKRALQKRLYSASDVY